MKLTTRIIGVSVLLAGLGGLTFALGGKQSAKSDTSPTPALNYTWQNVVVRGGGFVSGIITHPKERGLMYARTDVGGAYRWDDPAKRWIPLTDEFGGPDWNFTGIESIAVDPTDANKVYIAAGTYTNDWAGNGAILRSSDKGKTWKKSPLPFKNGGNEDGRSAGERLAVDPNSPANLFFGTRHEGLWQSKDSGATWKKVESFPVTSRTNGIGTIFVLFDKKTKTIYAGVSDKATGLYRSTDNGATWKAVAGQPAGFLPHHGVLSGDGSLYVTYGDAPGPNGMSNGAVWKWDAGTGTWSDVSPIKPTEDDKFGYAGVSVDAKSPQTLVVTTMDRWAKHDTIFRTTDGGKTWKDLGPQSVRDSSGAPFLKWGRPEADAGHWMGDIEIDPFNPDRVLYVTGMGIWTSSDMTAADKGAPTHWHVGANGLEELVVNDMVSPSSGAPLLSVVWDVDGFRHTDINESPGMGFYQPARGRNTGIDFAEKNPQIVARVFGGGNGGAYSADNGITWKEFGTKPSEKGDGAIAVSADGSSFVWTPENAGAFVSKDNGMTWTASTGLPPKRRVASDRVNPNTFYAFDNDSGTFYVSTDGGASFAAKATGLPTGNGFVRAAFGKEGDVWVAAANGLHHSTDGGASFAKIGGVENAQKIGFGKAAPGRDYPSVYITGKIGGVEGFFRSDDGGTTWVRVNDDAHDFHYVNAISGDQRVWGRVYIATGGRGIIVGDPAAAATGTAAAK
ncbi:MAG: carbohydrate-binding protein [Fibrella sp.]|nr:carbohydrate-binding protein [Armatimonadota bacterium]